METSSESSRSTIISPQHYLGSPGRPLAVPTLQQEAGLSPLREPFQPVVGSPHQVTREEITLQEPPPFSLMHEQAPLMDLPLFDGTELDLNLGTSEPSLTVQDLLPPASTPAEHPREKRKRPKHRQDTMTQVPGAEGAQELTPERRPSEELPETRAVPPSPGVTLPVITSPLPRRQKIQLDPLELEVESASPARKRRKRQLGFADAEIQIPKAVLKNNFTNTEDITENFLLPAPKPLSANDLLNMPAGRDCRNPKHLQLWKRNARTHRNVADIETSESSSQSDIQSERAAGEQRLPQSPEFIAIPLSRLEQQFSPVLPQPDVSGVERSSVIDQSIEALRQVTSITGASAIEDIELSAVEQARDISTSMREQVEQISMEGSVLADSAKKDTSTKKRRRTRSVTSISLLSESGATGPVPSVSVSRTLYDVQEEQEHRVPERVEIELPLHAPVPDIVLEGVAFDQAVARQAFLRKVRDEQRSSGETETSFFKLCSPAETDRKTAAVKFSTLLDLCGQRRLRAYQPVAYGDIRIGLIENQRRKD